MEVVPPLLKARIKRLLEKMNDNNNHPGCLNGQYAGTNDQEGPIHKQHRRWVAHLFYPCGVTVESLQQGPSCGFVALLLAAKALGLPTEKTACCGETPTASAEPSSTHSSGMMGSMMAWARERGYTTRGEIFSARWVVEIFQAHWQPSPASFEHQQHSHIRAECIDLPQTPEEALVRLRGGQARRTVLLVPYDCDKNHEPCERNGHSAHWALIAGFLLLLERGGEESMERNSSESIQLEDGIEWCGEENADFSTTKSQPATLSRMPPQSYNLHLIAYHGKSYHPTVWSYEALRRSNAQLNSVNPNQHHPHLPEPVEAAGSSQEGLSSFCLPPEGIAAIRGKCVMISSLTSTHSP